jgi:hypothetical protein
MNLEALTLKAKKMKFCHVGKDKARLIHYGDRTYDLKKFHYVRNDGWVKPIGGLWTSPVNSQYGWRDWCEAEYFESCLKANSFLLKVKPWARICVIDTLEDLHNFPFVSRWDLLSTSEKITKRKYSLTSPEFYHEKTIPDFETLKKRFDAIWLTVEGQWRTRLVFPINLYGWDCETVLILNPISVVQVYEEPNLEDVVLETDCETRMKEFEKTLK